MQKLIYKGCVYHLRFAVLWKAYITNSDGTVATVFGENFLSNPYIPQEESANKSFYTMPNSPNIFIASNSELKVAQTHLQTSQYHQHSNVESETLKKQPSPEQSSKASFRDLPNPFTANMIPSASYTLSSTGPRSPSAFSMTS